MGRLLLPRCEVCTFALVLAAGCGFRSPAASTDDGAPPDSPDPPDDGSIDAPTDAPTDTPPAATCLDKWRTGPLVFSSPMLLANVGTDDVDRDPFLSPDELTIYFSTIRSGTQNEDIFVATRTALGMPFGAPARRDDISSSAADTRFSMSSDERLAVVASSRAMGEGNSDVWIGTRPNKGAPFTFSQTGIDNINTGNSELDPELSADGLRIYLAIGSPQRIAVSVRSNTAGSFGNAQQIDELFSNAGDADPSVSVDQRLIIFSSQRGGGNDGDLYYATRADKDAAFGTPVEVPGINSNSAHDGDPALSPDGCRLYFASERSGNWELYVTTMTP